MPKSSFTEDMFFIKDGFYRFKNPENETQKYSKYLRIKCPSCKKFYMTTRSNTKACSEACRSDLVGKKNLELFTEGHYKKGDSKTAVELFTGAGHRYLIDNEDLDSVKRVNWTTDKDGYIVTNITLQNGKTSHVKLHRFVMNAKKGEIIDHIDNDVSNNTKTNLRLVSKSLNGINRNKKKSRSNTGYLGVSIIRGLYVARIGQKINGKRKVHYFSSKVLSEAVDWAENKRQEILNGKI